MIRQNIINNTNLAAPGVVGDLDAISRADGEFQLLSIEGVFEQYAKYKDVGCVLVGLWCFHSLELPQRERGEEHTYGYEYIDENKLRIISDDFLVLFDILISKCQKIVMPLIMRISHV